MELKENNAVFFRSLTKKTNHIKTDSIESFLELGKITRVHGLKGELFVSLFSSDKEIPSIIKTQSIQIRKNTEIHLETPIQEARLHKEGLILQLQGVENREQAELLKGASLFIPKNIFSSKKGEKIYLCEILNFTVNDKARGKLGKIFAFSSNGSQDLLLIKNTKNEQTEIPFIEPFIIHIDFALKKVQVDLPLNWPGLDFS